MRPCIAERVSCIIDEYKLRFACSQFQLRFAVKASATIMRGGAHRMLRAHTLAFESDPAGLARQLPAAIPPGEVMLYVALAGPTTTAQELQTRPRYVARRAILAGLLQLFCSRNKDYFDATIDHAAARALRENSIPSSVLLGRVESEEAAEQIDADADTFRRPGFADAASNGQEELMARENASMFISENAAATMEALQNAEERVVAARQGGALARDSRWSVFSLMLPEAFPFGRGHPGDQKSAPVS
eukprot:Plantae.Rhodophyta-Hildenbrandia_rubra.ctg309.p2 GENE.Plantae.Rhodophyta-Hildenbrandia_rubra.ctg309~~Plantae.Rhodophyta-Hildenbrandia_rubra.ctg309.p2  ORF type:complete len:246 (-),score=30.07 Plantae.Rhodophyta-Hildenbrandia_rubra.ctg309:308-1045(-)